MNPTQTVEMEFFPQLNTKTLAGMTAEQEKEGATKWVEMFTKQIEKFPEEWKRVKALLDEMNEPQLPVPEGKTVKGQILVPDIIYDFIIKTLAKKTAYKMKFPCDDYYTTFKMVDGKVMGYDKHHDAEGRETMSNTMLLAQPYKLKVRSIKGVLRMCYDEFKTADTDAFDQVCVGIIKSLPDYMEMTLHLRFVMASLACLVARKYGLKLVASSKGRFVLGCTEKPERQHVEDLMVLLSAL